MSPRDLSNRRIYEVQQALATYKPQIEGTDLDQLGSLARAVLASVDVRDLKNVSTEALVEQLEHVLDTIKARTTGTISVKVRELEDEVVVESCMDDQPFLVSALRALFDGLDLHINTAINAVCKLRRDRAGLLRDFGAGTSESVMRLSLRAGSEGFPDDLESLVLQRLQLAQAMVRDFRTMKRHLESVADDYVEAAVRSEPARGMLLREAEALLRWLTDDNYVIFSVEEYDRDLSPLEIHGAASVVPATRARDVMGLVLEVADRPVRYLRSPEDSPVHRAGKPGQFMLPRVDRSGEPVGVLVVDGLFTYKALHTPPEEIPYLRQTLRELLADSDVGVESHRGKNITNAFNSLPLEYLLTESRDHVWALTDRVLRAEEEGGSDVELRISEDKRSAFLFVTLPREQFSEYLRLEVQRTLLERFGANYADYGVYIDRYDNAIVHFYVTSSDPLPEVDIEAIRDEVHGLAKGWRQRLREAVSQVEAAPAEGEAPLDEEALGARVDELVELYEEAFNEEHRRRAGGARLQRDIACLERIRGGSSFEADLFVSKTGDHPGSLNMRVFGRGPIHLSGVLPVIVNFGFDVVDSYTREVRLLHTTPIEMQNFRFAVRRDRHRRVMSRREEVGASVSMVLAGELGDDSLNRLVVSTNLRGRDVEILRAYVSYMHQLRSPYATELLRDVLVDHPTVSQSIMAYLSSRFDPQASPRVEPLVAAHNLDAELKAVSDYTADRVLSAFAELIRATVRTNAFIADIPRGEPLSFKIASRRISFGPEPRPYREIWVYGPDFEGVHLRGGKVARGGLRFSDRPDDFRTEIHGLMATQMVKNVLIVPMGAKGGFVLREAPADRRELRRLGDAYYQKFIRALLAVTDNVVDGAVVTPEGILHTEGDDPYLVVAADKGTAHLSDTANSISMEQGFWLDDAFASGGSNGYDHKKTGITARGAWEATKRNFRELGLDPESDEVTVIGVGDMSGDVFGNGLLRSRTFKLLAAFNHLHVFIDPSPDPAASYEERKRLFEAPGSSWKDYSASALSEGGGVFDRKAKELDLSPQARALLGFGPGDTVSGDAAIRAIMRMRVDLCWMGGIGTYVKASSESHADVGDKSNDSVRVDARELRCRIFAEGANLAITDRGRVEFARQGGLGYTAFLDNSGGVDVSDHEVNIKILCSPLLASGALTREARNALLAEVEDEVCQMVLDNNRSQSRMVSFDVLRSRGDLWRYARTQHLLAREVPFDPEAFSMPTDEELSSRFRRGEGLYKPEAAVLGSHAKMLAYRQLLADEPLPEALGRRLVQAYFPARVRDAVGDALYQHLLGREIATTMLVNWVVDNAGCSFFAEVMTGTGTSAREVAVAYMALWDIAGLDGLLEQLYALEDKHHQAVVYRAMVAIQASLEAGCYYMLDNLSDALAASDVAAGRALLAGVGELLPLDAREELERRRLQLIEQGLSESLAAGVGALSYLTVVLDALALGRDRGRSPQEMLQVRLHVASRLGFPGLYSALADMKLESPFDGPAIGALARQLDFHVHKMARLAADGDVESMVETYGLEDLRRQVEGQLQRSDLDVSGLVLLDSQLRRLLPPKSMG